MVGPPHSSRCSLEALSFDVRSRVTLLITPFTSSPTADVSVAVIRISREPMSAPLQLLIQLVEYDIRFFQTSPRGSALALRYHFTSIW